MDSKLVGLTYDACDAFKEQAEYKRLLELRKKIDEDKDVQKLISVFSKTKKRYEEAKKYGQYHPDLSKYQKEFQEKKVALMEHKLVKEYKNIEKSLQRYLDQFSIDLANIVSKNVKHPKEMTILNLEER